MNAGAVWTVADALPAPPLATVVFQSAGFGWLGSLLVALCVAATVLAYTVGVRWQQQAPLTRLTLLGLRLGAVVCLFLTLLHPTWISRRDVAEKPLVAVVLDDSASMAEPAGPANSEMAKNDNPKPSRYARAVGVLRDELTPALAKTHQLRIYDVGGRVLKASRLPSAPTGTRSPLTDTLLRVQRELAEQPLVGIALLSDGAENTERPVIGGLEQLRVPVYAIDVAGAAAHAGAPDLAIQAVSANRRALVGNTVQVAVDVTLDGDPGDTAVPASVFDGDQVVASRVLRWEPDERSPLGRRSDKRVELEFIPRRAGEFTYTVAIGGLPNEADLSNNRQTFPLTVAAKPLTVLYIDGVLRWEGKFIREALAADPDINVVSSIRTVRGGADRGSQGLLLPEQLANIDVVILGDVESTYFTTSDELTALAKWVTDKGGGLVLTGGYHSFGPEGFGRTELRNILPIEFSASANPQIEQPFNLRLTDAGREHPLFHLTGDRLRDTAFFQKLPPLDGCSRIAGVKPGAEVLAVNAQAAGADGQALPVLVAQQVGAGRTLVFAVDTTWRWRTIVGGFTGDSSFYSRFWGQLVRWMAGKEVTSPPQLFASTNRSRYQLGETIELNIELRHDQSPSGSEGHARRGWKVAARALDEDGQQAEVPLSDLSGGKYRGTLGARRPGRLDLMVSAAPEVAGISEPERKRGASDTSQAEEAQSQVVTLEIERPDAETRNSRPDPQWLARVAQLSGGRVVAPDQVRTLAAQLPAQTVPMTVVRSSGVWGDRVFGSAFVVLLCAEWILRRRSQLA